MIKIIFIVFIIAVVGSLSYKAGHHRGYAAGINDGAWQTTMAQDDLVMYKGICVDYMQALKQKGGDPGNLTNTCNHYRADIIERAKNLGFRVDFEYSRLLVDVNQSLINVGK